MKNSKSGCLAFRQDVDKEKATQEVFPGSLQDFTYLFSNCLEITASIGCVKKPLASNLQVLFVANFDYLLTNSFCIFKGLACIKVSLHLFANRLSGKWTGSHCYHSWRQLMGLLMAWWPIQTYSNKKITNWGLFINFNTSGDQHRWCSCHWCSFGKQRPRQRLVHISKRWSF